MTVPECQDTADANSLGLRTRAVLISSGPPGVTPTNAISRLEDRQLVIEFSFEGLGRQPPESAVSQLRESLRRFLRARVLIRLVRAPGGRG